MSPILLSGPRHSSPLFRGRIGRISKIGSASSRPPWRGGIRGVSGRRPRPSRIFSFFWKAETYGEVASPLSGLPRPTLLPGLLPLRGGFFQGGGSQEGGFCAFSPGDQEAGTERSVGGRSGACPGPKPRRLASGPGRASRPLPSPPEKPPSSAPGGGGQGRPPELVSQRVGKPSSLTAGTFPG